DDAVEVLRIALRLHERLATAARASLEVRVAGLLAVEVLHDLLARHRRLMNGAVPEVDHARRVVLSPDGIDGAALMPRVGPRRRVATAERDGEIGLEGPGEATVAAHVEFAVPAFG